MVIYHYHPHGPYRPSPTPRLVSRFVIPREGNPVVIHNSLTQGSTYLLWERMPSVVMRMRVRLCHCVCLCRIRLCIFHCHCHSQLKEVLIMGKDAIGGDEEEDSFLSLSFNSVHVFVFTFFIFFVIVIFIRLCHCLCCCCCLRICICRVSLSARTWSESWGAVIVSWFPRYVSTISAARGRRPLEGESLIVRYLFFSDNFP